MSDIKILQELEEEIGEKLEETPFNKLILGRSRYSIDSAGKIIGLNLTQVRLTRFPKAIARLKNLQQLFFYKNQLTNLPPEIAELKNLQTLYLPGNQLRNLPPEITQLTDLQELYLSDNQLISFPENTGNLKNLQALDLSENRLTNLPPEIGKLKNLQTLKLSVNQLTYLPPEISGLRNLRTLDLDNNRLKNLPGEITELKDLQRLDAGKNQLSLLPPEIIELEMDFKWDSEFYFNTYPGLNFFDNPLESPPIEVVKQGREAVRNYFHEIADGKETVPLYEAKLLIVGQGGVGKTCLLNKLMNSEFALAGYENKTTEGVDIHPWDIKIKHKDQNVNFRVNFWDFGGQEIYHATHQFFLTKRSLYIFVWNARRDETYLDFDYWLNIIQLLSDNSPTLMVMNKSDERIKELPQVGIQEKFPNLKRFLQVSVLEDKGMEELRREIQEQIAVLPHVGDKLPGVWTKIRQRLDSLKEDYISYERFLNICVEFGLDRERGGFLSEYFHDLGVFLHYMDEELLEDLVIIKPEWGTSAVYRVLDNRDIQAARGRFTREDLRKIWSDYPDDKHPHLLRLMQKFELCFRQANGESHNRRNIYVAPELMQAEAPEYEWLDANKGENSLRFEYYYDFMPAGIITRFIVRQHHRIENNTFWKDGVVLRYALENENTSRARIIAEPLNRKIKIEIQGKGCRDTLAILRSDLKHIHETLNNPRHKEMVACICEECKNSDEPHLFIYSTLRTAFKKGRKSWPCEKSYDEVSIPSILKRFEPERSAPETPASSFQPTPAHRSGSPGSSRRQKIRVLIISANPYKDLDITEEVREIKNKIRGARNGNLIELIMAGAARPDDLLQALNEYEPHIVHFSGHGNTKGIILQNAEGEPVPVTAETLERLFKTFKNHVRLVFLNACFARPQAEAITRHIEVAIGMNGTIDDRAARNFSASFYRALAFGRNVHQAFEQGELGIELDLNMEKNTPQLITRMDVMAEKIVLIPGT